MSTIPRLTVAPGASGTATRPVCDFCCAPTSRWVMSCADITFIAAANGRAGTAASLGAWCACDGCQLLIQRGDVTGLADRVARSKDAPAWLRTMTTLTSRRQHFAGLYRGLLPQLQPARPLTRETAAAWQAAYRRWKPGDEVSSRAVAEALEAS